MDMKELAGMLTSLALVFVACILCVLAWYGLENQFGWQITAAGIGVCLIVRFFAVIPVGVFLFAQNFWGWDLNASLALAIPSLLLVVPWLTASLIAGTSAAWRR